MTSEKEVFPHVLKTLQRLNISYMISGSVASIAYGEPRLTIDMDVVVKIDNDQAKKLSESFDLNEYYVSLSMMLEAIDNKGSFNIIHSPTALKVDFYVLGDDDFSREEFARKQKRSFDKNFEADFATPEDVILKKLEWYKMGESQKHLEDIKGILKISGSKLDFGYLKKWAVKLEVWKILNPLLT